MSMDSRSSSALFKRAEQLKRWEESETNRESGEPRSSRTRKIKFPSGCVFLSACAAGDKDEVLKLLKKGADIDTANVDGLSALHQACIDDNLDMVEFLVEHGADVNKGDNEGWTPLHATASCGFLSIAKYLIEHGANVAAVNNDGELPVDIAESDEMENMLQQEIEERGIDAESARTEEERLMLADAKNWLKTGVFDDQPHPKTGATALHVAAAKGYSKVMDILLKGSSNIDAVDLDGWTPLHAAAHWGQREACELLVEHNCDMDIKNCVGQTAFDVADADMIQFLEELKKKQATYSREKIFNKTQNNNNKIKSPVDSKPVITDNLPLESDKDTSETVKMRQNVPEIPTFEVEIQPAPSETENRVEKKNRVNREEIERTTKPDPKLFPNTPLSNLPLKQVKDEEEDNIPPWRKTTSLKNRETTASPKPNLSLKIGEKEPSTTKVSPEQARSETPQEVVLRRTQSFEADEKFYQRYLELRAKIKAGNSCPTLHSAPTRSASLKEKHFPRRTQIKEEPVKPTTAQLPPSPTSPTSQPSQVRRSFVPPVRDEESETQRKAHAKRVRETRRSTQGVTLEELKSAEQLVKKKQQQQLQQATHQISNSDSPNHSPEEVVEDVMVNVSNASDRKPLQIVSSSDSLLTPVQRPESCTKEATVILGDRRPSWRLRVDNGSKFMLEDARTGGEGATSSPAETASVVKKIAIATPVTETGDTTVNLPLRKNRPLEKDEKENDFRNAQATNAVITRRRRPKRRSTGVVQVDMEEIDPDRNSEPLQGAAGGDLENSNILERRIHNSFESGPEKLERAGSSSEESKDSTPTTENGEIDYKKLYEECLAENEKLRQLLQVAEENLKIAKSQAENTLLHKNSLSEAEKRERRTLERKLSEMEEELKKLEQLKCENQKLKDENGALIRVISKLSK